MEQMNLDLPELKPHIGIRLRNAREEQGLTPSCVAGELKIQPDVIEAIEALDRDSLPSIGYVLGYVRGYAGFVGLNGQAAVEDFKIDSEVPENLGMRDSPHFVPKKHIRLPRGFFAATTVLSCTAVLAFWYSSNTTAQSSALSASSSITQLDNFTAAPEIISDTLIAIEATAPTWIEIKDNDGKVVISRIFITGERWETENETGITLSARDSGAIKVFKGAQLIGVMGPKGSPVIDVAMTDIPPEFLSAQGRQQAGLAPHEAKNDNPETGMSPAEIQNLIAGETKNGL